MNSTNRSNSGSSTISLVITLVIIGVGAFIGVQYSPQRIEAGTVGSILDDIKRDHMKHPVTSMADLQRAIEKQLNINEMNELKNDIEVSYNGRAYIITAKYERDLNLIYETKQIHYEKSVVLD